MARRLDRGGERILSREELRTLGERLALLGVQGVREFYQRAHRECAIINSGTFPPARAVQELVAGWRVLRRWRRR